MRRMMHHITCEEGARHASSLKQMSVLGFPPKGSIQAASLCCPGLLAILFSELILDALQECKGHLPAISERKQPCQDRGHFSASMCRSFRKELGSLTPHRQPRDTCSLPL